MSRVRTKLQPLLAAFEATELAHPIHDAILVGITDRERPDFFEEVQNDAGFFHVLAGCASRELDNELATDVFDILQRAVRLCPFATPDQEKLDTLFTCLRATVLSS